MNARELTNKCIIHSGAMGIDQEEISNLSTGNNYSIYATSSTWFYILPAAIGIIFLLYLIYQLIKPINWTKDLTDTGFEHLRGSLYSVDHVRKTRKTGSLLPPPFPNGWFAVMESKDLRPGEVQSVNCLGENFAVLRTETGEPAILEAYCPHLGANMAIGGVVRGNCLECPFHQWRFSIETGMCSGVPYSTKGNVPKAGVRKWLCREVNGSIFVWHHMNPEQSPWELPSVPEIDTHSWIYRGRNEFYINCHIQEIPENGADIAHLNCVHSANLFSTHKRYGTSILSELLGHIMHTWNAAWEPCAQEGNAHCAVMHLQHAVGIKGTKIRLCEINVTADQIGPGYVQLNIETSMGRMVILQTVTPLEPLVQKVIHRIYCPWYLIPYASFVMLGECIMFERDIAIWNHKKYMSSPHFLREDKAIKKYRSWYQQFYSEHSKSFEAASQTLEW